MKDWWLWGEVGAGGQISIGSPQTWIPMPASAPGSQPLFLTSNSMSLQHPKWSFKKHDTSCLSLQTCLFAPHHTQKQTLGCYHDLQMLLNQALTMSVACLLPLTTTLLAPAGPLDGLKQPSHAGLRALPEACWLTQCSLQPASPFTSQRGLTVAPLVTLHPFSYLLSNSSEKVLLL